LQIVIDEEVGMGQEQAWIITLVLMIAIIAPFIYIARNAGDETEYPPVQKSAGRIRTVLFWGLVVFCTPVIVYSLSDLPYAAPADGAGEPLVINAVGHQWYWEIDTLTVPAGRPVAFHVTSADVNHGFGIYDTGMRIVAQTQAMPEYTNILYHTFTEPGTYRVLCLEYCGLAHHGMAAEITVTPAES
jgi:cytochrome c oxidase subunit 2